MTTTVLRRVISARIKGSAVPLSLEYSTSDPVAIRITLGQFVHRSSWHVARGVIAAWLTCQADITEWFHECAGDVLLSRLPGSDLALLLLRSEAGRWPVTVSAGELEEFVAATYEACPLEREAQLVSNELGMQIAFFKMAQGGGDPA